MNKAMVKSTIPFLLILSIVLSFFIRQDLLVKRDVFLQQNYMDYTLPSKITGPMAMEFKGIVSDFLFLKVSIFFGDKYLKKQMLETKHAEYAYQSVDVITDLDPWFWDAYLFSDMLLTWDFQDIDKANKLLFKAREYRTNDFKIPYFIGFNYFYFLKDNANGAKYLMEAAKLPSAPGLLTSLATRLAIYQNQYSPAIIFIKDILKSTNNPQLKEQFELRLNTLIIMDDLEKKIQEYRKKYGIFPEKITDLVEKGLITTIPIDPYGGEFFILENGRVFTTSKMIFIRKKSS